MFLLDMFLGYELASYGIDVFTYYKMDPEERQDPMHVVFPEVG